MCKENENKEAETAAFYAQADAAWGNLPLCRISHGCVSPEKHPSGFVLAATDIESNEMRYRYSFDCIGSLELFIKSMTEWLDAWKAREVEG